MNTITILAAIGALAIAARGAEPALAHHGMLDSGGHEALNPTMFPSNRTTT